MCSIIHVPSFFPSVLMITLHLKYSTSSALYLECSKKKVSQEMKRTTNLLLSNFGIDYTWRRMGVLFTEACAHKNQDGDLDSNLDCNHERKGHGSVHPVGSGPVNIEEICAIQDFVIDMTALDNYPETCALHLPKAFKDIVRSLINNCDKLSVGEFNAAVQLTTKIVSKMQTKPIEVKPSGETKLTQLDGSLHGIKEEDGESLATIESERTSSGIGSASGSRADSHSTFSGSGSVDTQSLYSTTTVDSAISSSTLTATDHVLRPHEDVGVELLFVTFVRRRLIRNPQELAVGYQHLLQTNGVEIGGPNLSTSLHVCHEVVPVYTSLCQLLLRLSLFNKSAFYVEARGGSSSDVQMTDGLPDWLSLLLVLSGHTGDSSLPVAYCSISTYLALVGVLKAVLLDLPLPALITLSPSCSPILDFNATASSSAPGNGESGNSTPPEPLLSPAHLNFVYNETCFYTKVTQLLWAKLGDDLCHLHLETASLLQQMHNLAEDASVCESVICSAMASSDEAVSYEARKRFCTLYNITRDLKTRPVPMTRREFDRPLFFMLDSLTHKLDSHNAQAMDWLHHCLKNGDVARILEPLLFILLHPDTSRVSVQHVNIHQPELGGGEERGRTDEADNAALAAAEARIYAISSTGGNVIYHANPEGMGRKRFGLSPTPTAPYSGGGNKIHTLTTHGGGQRLSSGSSVGPKWITSRFNVGDYEVPPSHEPNIIGGKYLSINMVMNPFGSMSSLASDAALESPDTSAVTFAPSHPDLSTAKRLDLKRCTKSADDVRRQTPTPTMGLRTTTPTPTCTTPIIQSSRYCKTSMEEDSLSDTDIVSTVVEELVDAVVDKLELELEELDNEEDEESSSSSGTSLETTTRQTMSESISIGSWVKPVSVNQLHSHILLYTQVYDSRRTVYALTTLWNIILTDPQQVLFSLTTTSISNRLGFRAQELQTLCARHRKSLFGRGFYSELDTESITAFRSSSFLEIIVTTCLYYIRSYYPGLPQTRLNEEEVLGNQRVRILACEILRLIFGELVTIIKRSPMLSCYMHDMLMRCKVQKVVLHSVVSSVYNFQFKGSPCKEQKSSGHGHGRSDDVFSDTIVEFNEKLTSSSGFQEDMQKSLLKLLEQLMVLEHKASPNSAENEKEQPTHNRKSSDSRASRIRFQPQMSTLKYCPNVLVPSQAMFLSAIQTALQQSYKAQLHCNWLSLVESTLPFAGRSLTRLVVCVISQLCHNLEAYGEKVLGRDGQCGSTGGWQMPPNYLLAVLKSLATLCHYCLLDPSNVTTPPLSPLPHPASSPLAASHGSANANPLTQVISNFFHVWSNVEAHNLHTNGMPGGSGSGGDPLVSARRIVLSHLPRILAAVLNIWKAVSQSEDGSNNYVSGGWEVMGNGKDVKQRILDFLSPISIIHGTNFMGAVAVVWYDLRDPKLANEQRRTVIPICSHDQRILVELIAAIRVLPMDIVLKTVTHVMKQPPQTTHAKRKRVPLEVCMLQFFLAYIRVFPGSQLLECWKSLLALLRDGLQVSAAQPLAQFHLLAILHEFVQAAPLIEDRKDQKDLQEVAQKLIDACTNVAGARLGQTRWLRRNLEVKPGPQNDSLLDDEADGEMSDPQLLEFDPPGRTPLDMGEGGDNLFLAKFSVQALNALAEFVAPVLDVVYVSEEKEKVVPLVSNIMYYVTPYLRNHR